VVTLCSGSLELKRKYLRILMTVQNKVIVGPDNSFNVRLRSIGTKFYLFNLNLSRNPVSSQYQVIVAQH
jgi:predicted SprT family Zn-dependent metalloprotease